MFKNYFFAVLAVTISMCFSIEVVSAKDVYVKGYYKADGTYVKPHIRSSPDEHKHNNYGPSQNEDELLNPRSRDYDRDGIPNYLDHDDDNDGILDDNDANPYGSAN